MPNLFCFLVLFLFLNILQPTLLFVILMSVAGTFTIKLLDDGVLGEALNIPALEGSASLNIKWVFLVFLRPHYLNISKSHQYN